jgi:hypothetical protein
MSDLREQLAALAHEQWSGWMRYFLSKCERADGSFAIPYDYLRNIKRQMNTPYVELSEREKDSDREEADKVLVLIGLMDGD